MKIKHLLSLAFLLAAPLSAQDYAPEAMPQAFLRIYIASGTGLYADAGESVIWLEGKSYRAYGSADVQGETGTYTYQKIGPNTGRFSRFIAEEMVSMTVDLQFTSHTTGTYSVADAFGTQTVTFDISLPATSTPDNWLYDKHYPWVWSPTIGWMYHRSTAQGVEVWHAATDTWHAR